MSSVVDKLTSIVESFTSLPIKIGQAIGNIFTNLFNWLNPFHEDFILKDIISFFAELLGYLNPFSDDFILKIFFEWISSLLKSIFVPDVDLLKAQFNEMLDSISSNFGLSFEGIGSFKETWSEKPVEDVSANYSIYGVGTFKLKFLDTSYLVQGVERFRPVIRGFVVFLLILYNYYQVLTFIGQDPKIMHTAEKEYQAFMSRKEK